MTQHNTVLTIAAASVAPILYVVFVARYATNSFANVDDWSFVPVVHAGLHGQLSLGQLWSQWTESRYVMSNMIDVLLGFADGFNQRSVILLSAAIFIATYAGLLLLVRQYLDRRLSPIPVFVIGAIWFSLADVQGSLWAAHLWEFLTVFFFILMLVVLLVPNGQRRLWFAIGLLSAVAASLASIQGFLCWPLGAICILWNQPWVHRVRMELVLWVGFMAVTIAVYFPGYNFGESNVCSPRAQCTLHYVLGHPSTAFGFLATLVGNVITPSMAKANGFHYYVQDLVRFEVVGVLVLSVAIYILIRSWRDRHSRERLPLPLLLIVFPLLSDAEITLGRSGMGVPNALTNRYVLQNLILLTGIVIYALARLPRRAPRVVRGDLRVPVKYLVIVAVAGFLVVQVTTSIQFGFANAGAVQTIGREEAQFYVNINRSHIVNKTLSCKLWLAVLAEPNSILHEATEDRLGEFQPASYRYYRKLGPWLPPGCQLSQN